MTQYIDKNALVAEIESLWKHYLDAQEFDFGWNQALDKVLSCLDTLEVKEVDLEEEIEIEWNKSNPIDEGMGVESAYIHIEAFDMIARHFFELGLKAIPKGENNGMD